MATKKARKPRKISAEAAEAAVDHAFPNAGMHAAAIMAADAARENSEKIEEKSCNQEPAVVSSGVDEASAMKPNEPEAIRPNKEHRIMTLNLKGLDKRQRNAIYTGAAVGIRIPVGAFPSKQAPQTLEVPEGIFAGAKQPRAQMTPEQRKEARKNAPKPTLAEKLAKAEARTNALREKLDKEQARTQTEAVPAL